jgi:deoxyribose-phosphate aldolase
MTANHPALNAIDRSLAALIDHTALKAETLPTAIDQLCREAAEHSFASVCVNPVFVRQCADVLKGTGVRVCTVVGFPLGASTTASKAFETDDAVRNGATEIDMVLAVGLLKSGNLAEVRNDIAEVVRQAAAGGAIVKVIFENALLNDSEKETACRLSVEAGAAFVKTSTGFSTSGATEHDVALMRKMVGPSIGVKAAGGIRTRETALAMVRAGASRIGASASLSIIALPEGATAS